MKKLLIILLILSSCSQKAWIKRGTAKGWLKETTKTDSFYKRDSFVKIEKQTDTFIKIEVKYQEVEVEGKSSGDSVRHIVFKNNGIVGDIYLNLNTNHVYGKMYVPVTNNTTKTGKSESTENKTNTETKKSEVKEKVVYKVIKPTWYQRGWWLWIILTFILCILIVKLANKITYIR